MEEMLLYRDPQSYVHNPDLVLLPGGEMLMVIREAPRRRRCTHIDPLSQATLLRSGDNGRTWGEKVTAARGGPNIGIQDPSIALLKNGDLLCSFFTWDAPADAPYGATCPGTFATISHDGGRTWDKEHITVDLTGDPGGYSATTDAAVQLANGDVLMPLYDSKLRSSGGGDRSITFRSSDGGKTWGPWGVMAFDPLGNVDFDEPALTCLPDGKLIAMIREERKKECLWQSESVDGGKSWSVPRRTGLWGFPADLLPLSSGALLCTYGHRRQPYGVRACLSYDGGKSWDYRNEKILCNDGIGPDIGYPSSVQLADGTIFTAYYKSEAVKDGGHGQSSDDPAAHFADGGLRVIAGCCYQQW